MIPGTPRPYGGDDWTEGCVAVTNAEMDVLYRLGEPGAGVLILGEGESAGDSRVPSPDGTTHRGTRP